MFEFCLKYIYENYTLTMTDLEDIEASFDRLCGFKKLDIYTLFREYMGKFGVSQSFDRLMTSTTSQESPLKFNRLNYPELYDVTIKCANNQEIKAHRCVLSTRLEYFNLMFNSSWSEATKDVIHLSTIPIEYMELIIDFLYNNDTIAIRKKQYTDSFLYHLMEICDQFLVTRLKNIVEVIMIEKMNARKCADMYEFAIVFNCNLLEKAALDYICQNMGRLLENRCLEHLPIDSLEKLSTHYRRIFQTTEADLTANIFYGDFLADDVILDFVDDFQIDLFHKNSGAIPKIPKAKKPERLSSDRRNYEKDAINHVKNLSIETSVPIVKKSVDDVIVEAEELSKSLKSEAEKWMKVSDRKDIKKKVILVGPKSNELLKNEPKEPDNFTPLKICSQKPDELINSPIDESPNEKSAIFNLSLGDFTPQKGTKLSQKQRRRQLSQSDNTPTVNEQLQSPPVKSVWNASIEQPQEQSNVWKIKNSPEPNGTNKTQPINITPNKNANQSANASLNESFFSPSPSKSSIQSPAVKSSDSFTKIIEDERKQKEYYNKMKSKSLLLTQIEETAICELKKFYNIDNVFDEHIEIERKSNINPTVNFAHWKHE